MASQGQKCGLGWMIALALAWLIIGLSCYYAGYTKYTVTNTTLHPKVALISSGRDAQTTCSYTTCYGTGAARRCSTTYYACWDHYVTFRYTPDREYVVLDNTTTTELWIYRDARSVLDDARYVVGNLFHGFYTTCAFIPRSYTDTVTCAALGLDTSSPGYYLEELDADSMYDVSIASLVFVCLFSTLALGIFFIFWVAPWCGTLRFSWPQCPLRARELEMRAPSVAIDMAPSTAPINPPPGYSETVADAMVETSDELRQEKTNRGIRILLIGA